MRQSQSARQTVCTAAKARTHIRISRCNGVLVRSVTSVSSPLSTVLFPSGVHRAPGPELAARQEFGSRMQSSLMIEQPQVPAPAPRRVAAARVLLFVVQPEATSELLREDGVRVGGPPLVRQRKRAVVELCIRGRVEVVQKRSPIRTFLLAVFAIAGAACVYEYGPLRCATSIDVKSATIFRSIA